MARIRLFILFLFIYTISFAQLNDVSLTIKREYPEMYKDIEKNASYKWSEKDSIDYEINKQCEGFANVMLLMYENYNNPIERTTITLELLKHTDDRENFTGTDWWWLYIDIRNKLNKK